MTPNQTKAFRRGMRDRRDGNTLEQVKAALARMHLSESYGAQQVIEGWEFMDNFILAQDMLEGKA
jgi:hypothetical protein